MTRRPRIDDGPRDDDALICGMCNGEGAGGGRICVYCDGTGSVIEAVPDEDDEVEDEA